MKHNTAEVAILQPDYLGFIFYEKSARFFDGNIPEIPNGIKKVGVFVNVSVEFILNKIEKHRINAVQLHGNESPEFCTQLKEECHKNRSLSAIQIIKVFSIKNEFNFKTLQPYEASCDYFLFDTKGQLPGGNGYTFDWSVLKNYPSNKPYFLSGGIGLEEIEKIKSFMKTDESKLCYAIDVNSKFEIEPGLKKIEDLEKFKSLISHVER